MALLRIHTVPDPVLRQKAQPVQRLTKRHQKLIRDMLETMREANGVGLAAPQVGVSERIIVVEADHTCLALVNPVLERGSGSSTDIEGCLSVPGWTGYVSRYEQVVVSGWNERGKTVRVDAGGLLARALQHEMDHLDGIIFTDKAEGLTPQENGPVKEGPATDPQPEVSRQGRG